MTIQLKEDIAQSREAALQIFQALSLEGALHLNPGCSGAEPQVEINAYFALVRVFSFRKNRNKT